MKIAIVANNLNILPTPPHHTWAPGIVMWNEARVLSRMGHKVRMYGAKGSQSIGQLVHFDMFSCKDAIIIDDLAQKKIRDEFYKNVFQQRVIKHLRDNPVDIIHLHDYRVYPLYRAANLGIPILVTLHGDYLHNFNKTPKAIREDVNKINFIAIGSVPKLPQGIKPPLVVIPNILDLHPFKFIVKPKDRFVFVGRITRGKGADLAIKASWLADVKLDLYGELATDDQKWEQEIKELLQRGFNTTYHGHLPHEKVNEAFDAKALLFPMREPEGFPSVVLESAVRGTPVITFGLGGAQDQIKNSVNGFLVKPGDLQGMVRAIKQIDQIDRKKCRDFTLEQFSELKIGNQLIETFQMAIRNFKSKRS